MNLLKKLFAPIWPPFNRELKCIEIQQMLAAFAENLPQEFHFVQEQLKVARVWGLDPWEQQPGFRFVTLFFPRLTLKDFEKRGKNFEIYGLKVFSKTTGAFEDISLLINNRILRGVKIANSGYWPREFDLSKIDSSEVRSDTFVFPPDEIELFYQALDPEVQKRLKLEEMFDVQPNKKTYYVFYDLEDGNVLATDKQQRVFSLVHDATPMVKRMKQSLSEILFDIDNRTFDAEKHLEERYTKSR